jgi:hypothetical protein
MWRGHVPALIDYSLRFIEVIKVIDPNYTYQNMEKKLKEMQQSNVRYPAWFSDRNVCLSHRASLFFKSPSFYVDFTHEALTITHYAWPVPVANESTFIDSVTAAWYQKMDRYVKKPSGRNDPFVLFPQYIAELEHYLGKKVQYKPYVHPNERKRAVKRAKTIPEKK